MRFEFTLAKNIKQKKIFSIVNCIGFGRSFDRLEFLPMSRESKISLIEISALNRFALISNLLFVGNYFCFFEIQSYFDRPLNLEKYTEFKKEQEEFFLSKRIRVLPFSDELFRTFGLRNLRGLDQLNIEMLGSQRNEIRRGCVHIYPCAFVFLNIGRIFSVLTLDSISRNYSFVLFWFVFLFRLRVVSSLFKFRLILVKSNIFKD